MHFVNNLLCNSEHSHQHLFIYTVVTKANIKFSNAKEHLMRLSRHGLRRTGLATLMTRITLALALTMVLLAVAALTVMSVLGRGGPWQQVGSAQLHVVVEVHPELACGASV